MAEQKRGGPRGHGPQGHGFQRPKDFRGTVSKLLRYIGRYKAALVVVFICLVISSVGSVMSSYLLKPIINDYILPGDFTGLLKMLALLLGLFLLSGLCSYAYARIMVHISQRTVAQMRQDLFDKLQDLPLRYFDTHQSGDLMSRFTNDMDTVSEMINSSFASVVSCALTFIGIVVMMLYMNWVLTLITFAFLVLMLLVVKGVGGRSRVSFQAQQQALGAMNGYIEEMVEGQKVIKVFNHESKAIAQFSGLNDSYRDAATAAQTYSGAMMPAMANLSRIDYAVTCCVGGLLAIGGMFDVGSLGAYLLYVKQVSQPISQISQQVNVLLAAVAGAERIFAVMEAEPEVDEGKTVIVSGSGNVAQYCAEKVTALGGKVVAMSDSQGYIYDPNGINLRVLFDIKQRRRARISVYAQEVPGSEYHEGCKNIWNVKCDIAHPCASQNEMDAAGAQALVDNGAMAVFEGANMPLTPEAIEIVQKNGLLYSPGKASNAGGVATSGLEMSQNSQRLSWTFEEVDAKLKNIMVNIYKNISAAAKKYGHEGDYVVGANIAGFEKVADSMIQQGVC